VRLPQSLDVAGMQQAERAAGKTDPRIRAPRALVRSRQ
jgi:hypothetical protein